MNATLSIMGLYNYDESIFDKMILPNDIDKENLIQNLVLELCDMELIYPSFDVMKTAIGFWSKKELPVWNKLVETTKLEYNPIYNFDRTEEYEDKETRNLTGSNNENRNLNGTNKEERDLSIKDTETRDLTATTNQTLTKNTTVTDGGIDTSKDYNNGFNENEVSLFKQNETTYGKTNTTTGNDGVNGSVGDSGTVENEKTDTGNIERTITDSGTVNTTTTDSGTVSNTHSARLFGNIGVTTTQQMIESERKVVQFNVVDFIIKSFKNRFCILVYNI